MKLKYALTKEKPKTELCKLFYKYGSDKCPQINHSYSEMYHLLFKDFKSDFKNVIEIGIGTTELMNPICGDLYTVGASALAWRDFFHNANIYALDIDKSVLFEENRIKSYYTDQSKAIELNKTINKILKECSINNFDLIIDDGSHIFEHQKLTIQTIYDTLKDGGFYVIEDVYKTNIFTLVDIGCKLGLNIIYVHEGKRNGDNFIVFQKNNI